MKRKPTYDREHAERIYEIVSNYAGVCSPEDLREEGLGWSEIISDYEAGLSWIEDAELRMYVSKAVDAVLRECILEEELYMKKLEEMDE